jgi:hypothetical protein
MEILQKLRELQRQEGELGEAEERGTQVRTLTRYIHTPVCPKCASLPRDVRTRD